MVRRLVVVTNCEEERKEGPHDQHGQLGLGEAFALVTAPAVGVPHVCYLMPEENKLVILDFGEKSCK